MDLGKLVWTISFLLVLLSSPMLVFDLIAIQRSVEIASGADIWYDGQVSSDLLHLQVAVREIHADSPPEVFEEVRLRLDNAFNRLNSLPEPGSSAWHTQGIGREGGLEGIRVQLDAIDRNLKLMETDPLAFRALADQEVRSAIVSQRKVSLQVQDRQNEVIGRMQSQVSVFQIKLLGYGVGFVVLVLALAWLMRRHMHSESTLRSQPATPRADRQSGHGTRRGTPLQPGQVQLSCQCQPRIADAAQRHPGILGSAGQRHLRQAGGAAGRIHRRHPSFRQAAAGADQRHPRPVEAGSGQDGDAGGTGRPEPGRGRCGARPARSLPRGRRFHRTGPSAQR